MTTITIPRGLLAEKLIIFSRFPEAGAVKTRLIPALGPAGAARLQRDLTEMTVTRARGLRTQRPVTVELCHAGGTTAAWRHWLGADLALQPQGPGNLGTRMVRALERGRQENFQRQVLIGADCPALGVTLLRTAFDLLAAHDLVLGPALDGGYYLLGLSRPAPELFLDQPWGTPELLAQTLAVAQRLALTYHLLPELADVDRPEDLVNLGDYPDLERG